MKLLEWNVFLLFGLNDFITTATRKFVLFFIAIIDFFSNNYLFIDILFRLALLSGTIPHVHQKIEKERMNSEVRKNV